MTDTLIVVGIVLLFTAAFGFVYWALTGRYMTVTYPARVLLSKWEQKPFVGGPGCAIIPMSGKSSDQYDRVECEPGTWRYASQWTIDNCLREWGKRAIREGKAVLISADKGRFLILVWTDGRKAGYVRPVDDGVRSQE